MAETQVGAYAVVFGNGSGTTFTNSTDGTTFTAWNFKLNDSLSVSRESRREDTVDEDGSIQNATYSQVQDKLSLTIFPFGSTKAAAKTANVMPAIGSILAIINADPDADISAVTTGKKWLIDKVTKNRSNSAKVSYSLECSSPQSFTFTVY